VPDERLRVVVPGLDPVANVLLQCCNALYTTAEQLIGQECEPSHDLVDPGGPGRGEVNVKTWVLGQPVAHCRRLVGGQVVADEMHVQLVGDGLVDRGEEFLELHGPVTSMKLGDHRAIGDIERRNSPKDYVQGGAPQAGDAAAGVVMTAPFRHAGDSSAGDFREDGVGSRGPDVRTWIVIVRVEIFLDRIDQVGYRVKHPAPQRFVRQLPEPASTRLSQDDEVGVKCNWKRGCLASQAWTFGCLCVA